MPHRIVLLDEPLAGNQRAFQYRVGFTIEIDKRAGFDIVLPAEACFMRGFGHARPCSRTTSPITEVVNYAGDVQVGGPLVQVGQRVIDSAAKMLIGQFFAAAEAE
jgi:hypothetical protein